MVIQIKALENTADDKAEGKYGEKGQHQTEKSQRPGKSDDRSILCHPTIAEVRPFC
jgi:hypothetical protein